MAKYTYLVELSSTQKHIVVEANSLPKAINQLKTFQEQDSHIIEDKYFRNAFRKPTMVQVGLSYGMSDYNIYRYHSKEEIPTYKRNAIAAA